MDMDKYGNMMLKLWDSGLPILRQSQCDFACPNTARLKFPSKVQKKLDETASQAAKARSASGDGETVEKRHGRFLHVQCRFKNSSNSTVSTCFNSNII